MFHFAWNAMQINDVGLDEFMTLCKLIGVEPYITVNAGFGDAHFAAEEVEYMNEACTRGSGPSARVTVTRNRIASSFGISAMSRTASGSWDDSSEVLRAEAQRVPAAAMRKADPSITLLASGNMPQAMDLEVTRGPKISTTSARWKARLRIGPAVCWSTAGAISPVSRSTGRQSAVTSMWRRRRLSHGMHRRTLVIKVDQTTSSMRGHPANIVHLNAQLWARYQQRFPAMVSSKTFLSIDEYAYFGGAFNRAPDLKLASLPHDF